MSDNYAGRRESQQNFAGDPEAAARHFAAPLREPVTAPGAGTPAATAPGRAAELAQAAYDGWRNVFRSDAPWSDLDDQERQAWIAAVMGVLADWTAPAAEDYDNAAEIMRLRDERDRLSEQLARAHAETRSFLARIDALARELEASAAQTALSKKSEIEASVAKRLRAITGTDPAIDPPPSASPAAAAQDGTPPVCPKCGTTGCVEDANSGWYDTAAAPDAAP